MSHRRVLVTGSNGFIGKNLVVRLNETKDFEVHEFLRHDDVNSLAERLSKVDVVIHLAGVNRPANQADFHVNADLTAALCEAVKSEVIKSNRELPVIFASSIQADQNNAYGRSKFTAEQSLEALSSSTGNSSVVFRLPGVFGKWCKPNYNSVVATFCHNIARDLPIEISAPESVLRLVYIDDVISTFMSTIQTPGRGFSFGVVEPQYEITISGLADLIRSFHLGRKKFLIEQVGHGLMRKLYSTYVSYVPSDDFCYGLAEHSDKRGRFVEMLKTTSCGQFSYFTAFPGVTRGGHYHHTKTEKFLVVRGKALFRFQHLISGELVELRCCGEIPEVVDTIPGWKHDITNIGDEEMLVMLWANEIFDSKAPDTIASEI